MYYRYKVVNKKRGFRKTIVAIVLIGAVLFLGYRYRHHLQFWKYSGNKLEQQVAKARSIKDGGRRLEELEGISEDIDRYKLSNLTDSDAYLLSGKVHYLVGESHMGGSFSDLVINDRTADIAPLAERELFIAMRDIRKAASLTGSGKVGMEYSLILAKASFYTRYLTPAEIKSIVSEAGNPEDIADIDDVRFFSMILMLNKEEDRSIRLLTERKGAVTGLQGKLFLASSEKSAKRYTNAIIHYSEVLKETGDDRIRKLVHLNMGEIYFNQSLFQESLTHFISAGEIDKGDLNVKIWMGKNYNALGDKEKAKSIWNEVLLADKTNKEAKRLLGVL